MGFFDSLFGGGQKAAAKEQARAAEMAMQERRAAEARARKDFSPYLEYGRNALPQYQGMIDEMKDTPAFLDKLIGTYQPSLGYQKRLDEGNRAITQAMNAGGMYGSGDFFKALQEHGQGVADQDIQQYLANILGIRGNAMNAIGGLANQGFNAASNIGNIAANTGAGLAQDQTNYGNAMANSKIASSNMLTNLLGLGGNALMGGISGYMGGGGYGGFGSGFGNGLRKGLGIYGHGLGDY